VRGGSRVKQNIGSVDGSMEQGAGGQDPLRCFILIVAMLFDPATRDCRLTEWMR
jgi:hypothetical protein